MMLGIGIGITAGVGRGASGPSLDEQILALFANGEQGAWYDPQDLDSMFQSSVGLASPTTQSQPIGLLTSRASGVSRGDERAVNREFASDFTGWSNAGGGFTATVTDGIASMTSIDGTGGKYQDVAVPSGALVEVIIRARRAATDGGNIWVVPRNNFSNPSTQFPITAGEFAEYRVITRADASVVRVYLQVNVAGGVLEVDYISVREIPGLHAVQATSGSRPTLAGTKIRFDGEDDKLTTTFPDMGSSVTIARSVPGLGAVIETAQTVSGAWDDDEDHHGLIIVDRALTAGETAAVTRWLNRQAGVYGDYAAALPSLRSFISANYDQPNPHNQGAMSSPPTVTAVGGSAPSGLSALSLYVNNTPDLTYLGGGEKPVFDAYRRAPEVTFAATGGNADDGQATYSWRVGARCNAERVGIGVLGTIVPHRFIVDGQYVSLTGVVTTDTGGGDQWYELDFGSKAERDIILEMNEGGTFYGWAIAPGDSIAPYESSGRRMIVMGDSITAAAGATHLGDGFADVCGDMLGIDDVWSCGVGGGGYVNTNGGTVYKLSEHLADANDNRPWDIIVVALGANDMGQTAGDVMSEVTASMTSLRENNPAAQIIVVGPWDVDAPSGPVANYDTIKAAIIAGIPSGKGIYWIDPEGVAYTKADAVHPDDAGHATLGNWLAEQIKTALGAVIPEPGIGDSLLMETGDALLLESGDKILLED